VLERLDVDVAAPRFTASVRRPLISFTTGASSICAWWRPLLPAPRRTSTSSTAFHVLEQGLQLLIGRLVVLLDQGAEGVLARDDREQDRTG
jgi:hypothetical protein